MPLEHLALKLKYSFVGAVVGIALVFFGKIALMEARMKLEKIVRDQTKKAIKRSDLKE